jgi:endonuclease/exonuclease/phosphatase family metal-dependent hydrolase
MRVLTWNLFHGRAVPDQPRSLLNEFAAAIAGWDWDVALLQEVPPWWPRHLATAAVADERHVLTSRIFGLGIRRSLAARRPDLIKSSGGGANAILVRPGAGTITVHASRRLRVRPERRFVHAVWLNSDVWVANVHAQVRPHSLTRADLALAGDTVLRWATGNPALLGGDCNVEDPIVYGFTDGGGHGVDRVLLSGGLAAAGDAVVLPRPSGLSDHAPVVVEIEAL